MDKEVTIILGDALCTDVSLKKLYMSGQNEPPTLIGSIGEGGMEYLARCLSRSNSLVEELHLSDNNITVLGGISLVEELSNNISLKVLDVYGAVSPTYNNTVVSCRQLGGICSLIFLDRAVHHYIHSILEVTLLVMNKLLLLWMQ